MEKANYRDNIELISGAFPNRSALSIDEVSKSVGCDRRTVTRAIDSGKLPVQRIGTRVFIPITSVARWLSC